MRLIDADALKDAIISRNLDDVADEDAWALTTIDRASNDVADEDAWILTAIDCAPTIKLEQENENFANFDDIRSMSNVELARLFRDIQVEAVQDIITYLQSNIPEMQENLFEQWVDWLKQ